MNWPLPKFVVPSRVDPDIARERYVAQLVQELLNGGHVYLYSSTGRIYATYTADTILEEECLYKAGDAAELLKDPEGFGRRLQARMKEQIEKWCDDHAEMTQAGPDNE